MNALAPQSPQDLWADIQKDLGELASVRHALVALEQDGELDGTKWQELALIVLKVRIANTLVALHERGALHDVAELLALTYGGQR
ncbi:hypothetical protein [Salipiger marinus]|uniref:hypothetical protein n=1 Tax=Salipiger marinus TaxID=555512 RepID=UPI004057DB55